MEKVKKNVQQSLDRISEVDESMNEEVKVPKIAINKDL